MNSSDPDDARVRTNNGPWPNGALAAVCLTIDNMGEAADLNRKLWPESEPIGNHFSVRQVIPKILGLLKKYDIHATYFIESWNINVYGSVILDDIVAAGHEVGWHAWQHEAWSKLDEHAERANFARSFGPEGIGQWLPGGNNNKIESYQGFRPPGGIIHGRRTLDLCRTYGLGYISPAGERAAIVDAGPDTSNDKLVVLPFKWFAVDAYYYMETFAGLRKIKGVGNWADPIAPEVLVQKYIAEIDDAIEKRGFLAPLFHPFLTERPERLEALEQVLKYLAEKRDRGEIWLSRCRDVKDFVIKNPNCVGSDPGWDLSSWR